MSKNNLWTEVSSIRMKVNEDIEYAPAGNNLYSPVVRFMLPFTESRDVRLGMLRTATGIPQLNSTKQLTAHACLVLIEEWKADDSWDTNAEAEILLAELAQFTKEQPSYDQREREYKRWLEHNNMSNL